MKKILILIKNNMQIFGEKVLNLFHQISWKKVTVEGALKGLAISIVIFYLYLGSHIQSGFGKIIDSLVGGGISIALMFAIGLGIFWIIRLIKVLPEKQLALLLSMIFLVAWYWDNSIEYMWPLVIVWIAVGLWFGGAILSIKEIFFNSQNSNRKVLLISNLFIATLIFGGSMYWLFSTGTDSHIISVPVESLTKSSGLTDPSIPGDFAFDYFTYGSGSDKRREEFSEGIRFETDSVNASSFYGLDDWETKTRKIYWGFDRNELPINGRVWMPKGEGPFPLVIMVHGNHEMNEYSDVGYGYLGELLASQGFIFISIDENYFNGYWSGGVGGENDARAWIILQHIAVLENWNQDLSHELFNKISIDNIALMGHSRGGEAVALAATFNQIDRYPRNANFHWDFNFGIKSVIAIAPTDQQFSPAGHPNPLVDVNYLVIQGAHDADVSSYYGFKQYQRVKYSEESDALFKAGLYIYQANHGQFNTVWGSEDFVVPKGDLLNRKSLLSPEKQQQILAVYVSGFLKATLKNESQYTAIFEDYRVALDWIPETLYMNHYQNNIFQSIANFEEDIDAESLSVDFGTAKGYLLSRWREEELDFRKNRSQENHALVISWSANRGKYQLNFETPVSDLSKKSIFSFLIANGSTSINDLPIDFSVEFEDIFGNRISTQLSKSVKLLPQFPVKITKLPLWEDNKFNENSEIVFQTVRIEMEPFLDDSQLFDIENIVKISFVFDQSVKGEIYIDEIGWETPPN